MSSDQSTGGITLVEVKSGKTYKRHVALDNLLRVPDYSFDEAVVLCNANVEKTPERTYLPVYAAGWL